MLARALEAAGLPTTTLVLLKEHAQRTKPPRALFVPFPYGYALGRPDDPAFQHRVIAAALDLLPVTGVPVLAEFPEAGDAPVVILQASAVKTANTEGDPMEELAAMRGYYHRWVEEHGGRTQVGATGISGYTLRPLVGFLQGYLAGDAIDFDARPTDTPLPVFIRRACDDLKAYMIEGRMAQRPDAADDTLYQWFWAETAIGNLVRRLGDKFKAEGDDRTAYGIAR